jgi:hypothetical protein
MQASSMHRHFLSKECGPFSVTVKKIKKNAWCSMKMDVGRNDVACRFTDILQFRDIFGLAPPSPQ